MCGVCGYFVARGAPPGRPALGRMADLLEHRGPDDVGVYAEGEVGLAVRRLSIIDVAGGHQPISNEDGSVTVILNGEIYNYAELAEGLRARGHVLRSGADTEVIVHLYEEMGDACVERLRGMFAFAVWDARRRRLLLARDRIGVKPLYVTRLGEGGLAFASEIKALLVLPGVERRICADALGRYLDVLYTTGRETIFEGITRLPPGSVLAVDASGAVERAYWDVRPDARATRASLSENADRLRAELEEAVRLHMVADVPVGALLSGGLDSSVVVALAAQATAQPLRTYTVAFDVGDLSANYDERPFARLVAERYGTEHTEVTLTGREMAALFPAATWHLDEPFGNPTAIATYVVSREARRSVKVVLSGDGGDELFGGYLRYAYDRVVSLYGAIPRPARALLVRPALEAMKRVGALKVNLAKLEQPEGVQRYAAWHYTTPPATRQALLTDEWRERLSAGRIETIMADMLAAAPRGRFQDRMMYADLRTWIPDQNLMQADKTSMMASLELRVPLLDHRIVELAAGVPFEQKVRLWPLETKRIVKRAFRDLLPAEILAQRKKGFFAPAGKWLRTELRDMAIDLLSPERLDRQGIFRSDVVQQMLTTHLERRGYYGHELWTLMSFQLWHETFMGATLPSTAPALVGSGA